MFDPRTHRTNTVPTQCHGVAPEVSIVEYREIPQNLEELGLRARDMVRSSHEIGPAANHIARKLHETGMLRSGEKWTLVMAIGCGFHAEIEMRVSHLGNCEQQDPEEEQPSSESSVIFAIREDGIRLPFPAPKIMAYHELRGRPGKH